MEEMSSDPTEEVTVPVALYAKEVASLVISVTEEAISPPPSVWACWVLINVSERPREEKTNRDSSSKG
jgi:hypothetical protein